LLVQSNRIRTILRRPKEGAVRLLNPTHELACARNTHRPVARIRAQSY